MSDATGILKPGTLVRALSEVTLTEAAGIVLSTVPKGTYGAIHYAGPEEHDELVNKETGEILGYRAYGVMWLCADRQECIEVSTEHFEVCDLQVVT